MTFEPVQVSADWAEQRGFIPRQFIWQGRLYPVDSTGRSWEDEQGLHILCMVPGGQVFELIFHLNPAGWLLKPPLNTLRAV